MDIYLESGKRKTFAVALEWPGWARAGRDEAQALQALVDYGPRYGAVVAAAGLAFTPPVAAAGLTVTRRLDGDRTTDFGAPGKIPAWDQGTVDDAELQRSLALLNAGWNALAAAVEAATGKELRRGPRGGGRELAGIVEHVIAADQAYLRRIAGGFGLQEGEPWTETVGRLRRAQEVALARAVADGLPTAGPRGGKIWPVRYYVRRALWHLLDHVWEIEDRVVA